MGFLYIVATPIGNLKDISLRALEVLKGVDLILCEDTRITKKLMDYHQIKTPTLSYHQHSKLRRVDYILELLKNGKSLALVSDAGTPGISDPGNRLIERIIPEYYNDRSGLAGVIPIPGPSAATAIASISGFPTDRFVFMGFPPVKKKRKKFFEEITSSKYPVIFYESPRRILKTLNELKDINEKLTIVVARELTKKFETIYRGKIENVIKEIEKNKIKGEFTVFIRGKDKI